MQFRRIVNGLEAVTLAVALVFVVLMVAYRPAKPVVHSATPSGNIGAEIYVANCAACHGSRGEGGIGPQLRAGKAVSRFPEVAGEVALVSNGRGSMPAWQSRLSAAEIRAVVDYTRTLP